MIVTATTLGQTAFAMASERHSLISDQSPEYGGEGLGPMPSELLLWAVAACFGQAVRYVAARRRQPMEALAITVSADKDAAAFHFGEITITVRAALLRGRLEAIVEQARRYCFVTASLSVPVRLEVQSIALPSHIESATRGASPDGFNEIS
ncbi:OsmC family protein [Solidesulfovibrio carbinoliphilus subsp. oakridgensis]|uniref:OsmC family protein n=1 Tax=Solidesulfovibrio carbinoliphilus subsp. oakridgensis TaxID=694327 RepID=G7Q7L5_9BACT|nr:OsmC family protein [Solidesulfovibrio carbinoliphilus]EHJ47168.1 OsmC family protein [Solidesulfovibrio carbinoliphilus subsp. oakridgensis]